MGRHRRSRIFTHLITTLGVGQSESSFFTTYNGMLHPDAIMGGWNRYQNKDINNDILVCFGYGDGGGGLTRHDDGKCPAGMDMWDQGYSQGPLGLCRSVF